MTCLLHCCQGVAVGASAENSAGLWGLSELLSGASQPSRIFINSSPVMVSRSYRYWAS